MWQRLSRIRSAEIDSGRILRFFRIRIRKFEKKEPGSGVILFSGVTGVFVVFINVIA